MNEENRKLLNTLEEWLEKAEPVENIRVKNSQGLYWYLSIGEPKDKVFRWDVQKEKVGDDVWMWTY